MEEIGSDPLSKTVFANRTNRVGFGANGESVKEEES